MSFSVGSGPMPQADRVAAPAPVTPRTFRNRLRFMPSGPSVISMRLRLVVTHGTVADHLLLHVTRHAPSHSQRRHLVDLGHALHVPVARRTRLGAEGFDVALVGEANESGKRVNPGPLRRLLFAPRVADLFDLGLMRRRRAADQLVAAEACL